MRKFFKQDKNYILYGAQFDKEEELIAHLIESAKSYYQRQYNPLGLLDDTILTIRDHSESDLSVYHEFYEMISAIYRYNHGSNQLEFLFDGMDHFTRYSLDWETTFKSWVSELFSLEPFLKTVLQISVFGAEGHSLNLALNRLNQYMFQHFKVKVYRNRGIQEKAA